MDKLKAIFQDYLEAKLLSNQTTFEQFALVDDSIKEVLYNQGIENKVISSKTDLELFKSAWSDTDIPTVKKKDEGMGLPLEDGSSVSSETDVISQGDLLQNTITPSDRLTNKPTDTQIDYELGFQNVSKQQENKQLVGAGTMFGEKPPKRFSEPVEEGGVSVSEEVEYDSFQESIDKVVNKELVSNDIASFLMPFMSILTRPDATEENVIPKMQYYFGEYGFKFEPADVFGDGMTVKASNGKETYVNLDQVFGGDKSAEDLKTFLIKNKQDNFIESKEEKIYDEKEIKDAVGVFNTQSQEWSNAYNALISLEDSNKKMKDELDGLSEDSDFSGPDYEIKLDMYNQNLAAEKQLFDLVKDKAELIEANGVKLDRLAGQYYEMKSNQGGYLKGIVSGIFNRGPANIASGAVSYGVDAYTYLAKNHSLTDQKYREELIRIAKDEGYLPKDEDFSGVSKEEIIERLGGDTNDAMSLLGDVAYNIKNPMQDIYGVGVGGTAKIDKRTNFDKVDDKIKDYARKGIKYYNDYGVEGLDYDKAVEGKYRNPVSQIASNIDTEMGVVDASREIGEEFSKNIGATKEWADLEKQGFWGGAVLGLSESIPAMVGGMDKIGFAQRTAQMFMMTSSHVDNEMDKNPMFDNISESEKTPIKVSISTVSAVLESLGFRNVMSQNSYIATAILSRVLKKVPPGASRKTLRNFISQDIESSLARGGYTLLVAGAAEFETGFAQQGNEIYFKNVYNELKDKKMFTTPESWWDITSEMLYAGAQESVGGFILGSPGAVSSAVSGQDVQSLDERDWKNFELMSEDPTYKAMYVQKLKTEIANPKNKKTLEDAKAELESVNKIQGLLESNKQYIGDYSPEQKKRAVQLLLQKQELENEIKNGDKVLSKSKQNLLEKVNNNLDFLAKESLRIQSSLDLQEEGIQDFTGNILDWIKGLGKTKDIGDVMEGGIEVDMDGTKVIMTEKDGGVVLESIETPENDRGQGKADASIKEITQRADKDGVKITLKVAPKDATVDAKRLEKFYARNGFEMQEDGTTMVRNPNTQEQTQEQKDIEEFFSEDVDDDVEKQSKNLSINRKNDNNQKNKSPFRASAITAAKLAARAIRVIAPNVRIVLHESESEYLKYVTPPNDNEGVSSGEYSNNVIHINLSNVKKSTVAHEVFHAVLLTKLKDNDALAKKISDDMVRVVQRRLPKENKLRIAVEAHAANYVGEQAKFQTEEQIAELIGLLSSKEFGYTKLEGTIKLVIKNYLMNLAKKLGISLPNNWGNDQEVVDLINTLARKTRTGEAITEKDVSILNGEVSGEINGSSPRQDLGLLDVELKRFPTNPNTIVEDNVSLSIFNRKKSNILESDRMTGAYISDPNNNPVFKFFGGIYFPQITGKWWASRTLSKANSISSNMNANRDSDGYIYATPIIMKPNSHMSNQDMFETVWEFMKFDLRSRSSKVTKQLFSQYVKKALSLKSVNLTEADLDIKKSDNIETMITKLNNVLIGKEVDNPNYDSTKPESIDNPKKIIEESRLSFEKRKAIIKAILGDPKVTEERKFPTAGSISEVASKFEEQKTKKAKELWDIVMVMRTKGTLSAKVTPKSDEFYHKSYPSEISSDQEIEVSFLDGAYNIETTYPKLTQASGKTFSWEEYSERHPSTKMALSQYGRTAKLSYASGEIADSKPATRQQRIDKASEKLIELFDRDNIPLTIAEAKAMVEEVYDWTTWYDGISSYVNDLFGEYGEDILSILPLSSMAANSAATVGMTINNVERIYKGEKPNGVAEYYGYVTDFLEGKGIRSDKMYNFLKALLGDKNAVAVDMHVYSIIMGKDPNKKQVNPSNKKEFERAKEFVNTLAKEMDLAPREVQAALWALNILRTNGKPDSYEQYFEKQVKERKLKERIEGWRSEGYKPFSEIRKTKEQKITPAIRQQKGIEQAMENGEVIQTDSELIFFKGMQPKMKNGKPFSVHKIKKGSFAALDKNIALDYKGDKPLKQFTIPKGTTVEVVNLPSDAISLYRINEEKAINASKAQVVKLVTTDLRGKSQQYIIKDAAILKTSKDVKESSVTSNNKKTFTARQDKSAKDYISKGRESNFSDEVIRDYLVRVRKFSAKKVDELLSLPITIFEKMPKSFGNIKDGANSGMKLFKRVDDYYNKLYNNNKKRKPQNQITNQEILDKTIEFLQNQPEYINESETYTKGSKKKGTQRTLNRNLITLRQAAMLADMQSYVGISPSKNMGIKIAKARLILQQYKKRKINLDKVKKELRNFLRKSLPKELYEKKDVLELIDEINAADEKNISNILESIELFVNKKNAKSLKDKIKSILNAKYVVKENGTSKGKLVDITTKKIIEYINKNILSENATEEEIRNQNEKLERIYNETFEQIKQSDEFMDLLVGSQLAIMYNESLLSDDIETRKVQALDEIHMNLNDLRARGRTLLNVQLKEAHDKYIRTLALGYEAITGEKIDMAADDALSKLELSKKKRKSDDSRKKRTQTVVRKFISKMMQDIEVNIFAKGEALDGLMMRIDKLPGELFGGRLNEEFTNKVDESSRRYKGRMMMIDNIVKNYLIDLYGNKWKAITRKNRVQKSLNIELHDGIMLEDLSQDQIAYLYNMYKDPSNKGAFENMFGVEVINPKIDTKDEIERKNKVNKKNTERVMKELISKLDPKVKELADWQVDVFYPSLYEEYNSTHKKLYRTELPQNDFYAGTIYREGVSDEDTNLLKSASRFNAPNPSATKARQKNNLPIKYMNMMDVLDTYVNSMEHFAAYGETIRDMDKFFKNKYVKDAIISIHGEKIYNLIAGDNGTINKIASRDIRTTNTANAMNTIFVVGRISLSPLIVIKQLTSMFTYMNDIGHANWILYSAKNKAEQLKVWKEVSNNSVYMKDRASKSILRAIETYSESSVREFVPSKFEGMGEWLIDFMMYTTKFGDRTAIMLGGLPNYSYYKAEFKKSNPNATEQEAIDHAIIKFERDTKRTQQSSDLQDKDSYQTKDSIYRGLNMFLTTPKQYMRKEIIATRELYRIISKWDSKAGKGTILQNVNTLLMYHVYMPVLFQYVSMGLPGILRGFRDDDDEDLLRAAIIGNLNAIFIYGEVIQMMGDLFTNKPWAGSQVRTVGAIQIAAGITKDMARAKNLKDPVKKQKAWMDAFLELATITSIPAPTLKKLFENYSNLNSDEDIGILILRLLNYSKYQIEGSSKGNGESKIKTISELNEEYHKKEEKTNTKAQKDRIGFYD